MTTTDSGTPRRNLDQLLARAGALYMDKQYEASGRLYAELTAHPRYAAEGWYGLGMIALVNQDLARAQMQLEDCLRRSPNHHRAVVGLGLVAEKQGDLALACRRYAEAARAGNTAAQVAVHRLDSAAAAQAEAVRAQAAQARTARAAANPAEASAAARQVPRAVPPGPQPLLARQPSGRGIVGEVSALQARQESRGARQRPLLVVTFRLEREGMPPLPVELRGEVLKGSISPGDRVELPARLARGRTVNAAWTDARFWNLTTGARVRVEYTAATVIGWIILLGLLVGGAMILLSVL